jgi:outer membrane protein OmpA-like peptidoglycan-associated protein
MTDVFISYKREERARCVAIYNALVDLKLSVWFDGRIEPGTDFDREIEREVRGAGAVLVLWSELAADSDWIRAEARTGRQNERLVAIRLDDCLPPLEFASVQAVDLFDRCDFQTGEGWRQIVGRIGRLVGRPGLGDYVRCEQEADAGRWRGWIAANSGDPLIDRARERLAVLERRPGRSVPVAEATVSTEPPYTAPTPRIADRAAGGDWLRRYGWIAAAVLLLALATMFAIDRLGGNGKAEPEPEKAAAAGLAEALPTNPEAVPMATGPATPGKLAFCRPDKPYVFTFTPGRTDLPPLWNLTVSNAWLAWRECRGPVRVEGHVEAGGGTQADSAAMADAIAKELVLKGIDPKAITRAGHGDTKPLAGLTADAKDNRRVEVYLMPPG